MLALGLLCFVLLALLGLVSWMFDAYPAAAKVVRGLFVIAATGCSYTLTSQRLRDMNQTGWLALLWLPLNIADTYVGGAASLTFLVILGVVPGTKGPNDFGEDPLEP